MDRKARPGRRGECVRGLLRCLRAAQPVDMAAFGVQFRCKIDSPARPLAPSLAVICVWQMLQGSVGTGLWAVGAHTMTRARDVHATWLAVAPPAAKSRQTQVEYYQPVAAALVTGRKVCPAGHGECLLHVWLRCLRAAEAAAHGVWDSISLARLTHQLALWRPRWLSFTCN